MGRARTAETSALPPGVVIRKRKSGNYYYFLKKCPENKRKEYPLGRDLDAALARWRMLDAEVEGAEGVLGIRPWLGQEMFKACKSNAKKRGIEFSLTLEDVEQMLLSSSGKCELTGIPFDLFKNPSARVRHWHPSIDRKDCSKGYVTGNVRMIAVAVNVALSDFGEDVLTRIAKGLIKVKYGKVI